MKAIFVNGSPRKKGNTFMLLNMVMDELNDRGIETELIQAGGRDIHGCIACGKCSGFDPAKCVFDDDLVNESIKKIEKADALIIGSPVYFGSLSAQTKAFIDRVGFATRPHKVLKGMVCASVSVARRNGALTAFNAINNLFTISEGIVVGSSYWNQGVGVSVGDVMEDEEGIETMKTLGQNVADTMFALKK
ncbi:MAG: flavodoxin family protein [Clostridia bacterium]|jgi:multimeric flavodoxin WrbA|nr:flavodoxin family protein [Clostridia bacterium]